MDTWYGASASLARHVDARRSQRGEPRVVHQTKQLPPVAVRTCWAAAETEKVSVTSNKRVSIGTSDAFNRAAS